MKLATSRCEENRGFKASHKPKTWEGVVWGNQTTDTLKKKLQSQAVAGKAGKSDQRSLDREAERKLNYQGDTHLLSNQFDVKQIT